MSGAATAERGVSLAVREAVADARRGWRRRHSIATAAAGVALALPLVVRGEPARVALARASAIVLAVVGLHVAAGVAGVPSLAQGAFAGVGAFAFAVLRARAGIGPGVAALGAAGAGAAAGTAVALATARLDRAFVAVATWVVSWLVVLALADFPALSGGAQGITVPVGTLRLPLAGASIRPTAGLVYEASAALVLVGLLLSAAVARGASGVRFAVARANDAAASALGVRPRGPRAGALVVSATLAGVAGAIVVQVAGVADPSRYGPLLSVELFVAVLVGGTATVVGPLVGALVLIVIPVVAGGVGALTGASGARLEPAIAAVALVTVVALGDRRDRLVRSARAWLHAFARSSRAVSRRDAPASSRATAFAALVADREARRGPATSEPALLAEDLSKRFGGVVALDRVSLNVPRAAVHAIIGPNGSGKTTCLRVLSGAVDADAGSIRVRGVDLTREAEPDRVARGIVRALPDAALLDELTVARHVAAGTLVRRRYAGAVRCALATPKARAEAARFADEVDAVVNAVGLGTLASARVATLDRLSRRLVSLATAWAARPAVLLTDELAGGLSDAELVALGHALETVAQDGVGVLAVEHHVRFVRRIAEHVLVLDAGTAIAAGAPDDVMRDPVVRRAYLGEA